MQSVTNLVLFSNYKDLQVFQWHKEDKVRSAQGKR